MIPYFTSESCKSFISIIFPSPNKNPGENPIRQTCQKRMFLQASYRTAQKDQFLFLFYGQTLFLI